MNFQEWLSLHEGPPVNMAVQQGEHKFELKAALSQYAPMLKEWGRKMSKATVSFQQDLASLKSLLAEFTNELLNPLEQVLRKGAASRSEPGPHFNFYTEPNEPSYKLRENINNLYNAVQYFRQTVERVQRFKGSFHRDAQDPGNTFWQNISEVWRTVINAYRKLTDSYQQALANLGT